MNRKIIALATLTLIIINSIVPIARASDQKLYYANTDGVNFRSGPSLNASIIGKLSLKQYVLRLGLEKDSSGNIWYKIYDFNANKTGYSASWLLNDSGVTIQGEDSTFTAKNKAEYLNVRVGPGTEFKIASTLQQNAKITVIRIIKRSDGENWFKFKGNDNNYYFVAGWYMEKIDEEPIVKPETQSKLSATSTDYVNLREGPSTQYTKITLVEKGSSVSVIGVCKNASNELWLQVEANGKTGWVYSVYFEYKDLPLLDTACIGEDGTVTDAANIRAGPSTEYKSIKVMPKDQKITILGVALNKNNETWYQTLVENDLGWINSNLVSIKKKTKGVLKGYSWAISPTGIDINIFGDSLPKPVQIFLEDPLRLALTFENTISLSDSLPIELNIYPIIRVRTETENNNLRIVIDLIRQIPNSVEYKDDKNIILHLTLPKINEKYIEVGGIEIYSTLTIHNNETFISLSSIKNAFNINLDSEFSFDFYGKTKQIDKSLLIEENGEYFMSLTQIQRVFESSILETSKEIFIDPVLTDYSVNDAEKTFTFSFPPRTKRIEEDGKYYIVFYADQGKESFASAIRRNGINPPLIKIEVSKNTSIEVTENVSKIIEKTETTGNLAGKIIIIDPGHGSYNGQYLDLGAIGPSGVKEAYVVMSIALKLKEKLEKEGAKVILTHSTVDNPNNPDLSGRVSIANSSGGDLFISIHINASINTSASGTETYYWYESSKRLAQNIQNSLVKSLNTIDRGVKKEGLYVCKNISTMPSILTEIVFISNTEEEQKCTNDNFLDNTASALKDGIEAYLHGG